MDGSQKWIREQLGMFAAVRDQPTFIQIGSFDGVTNDPLYKHVVKQGWKGVVVEPISEYFLRLQKNYERCPDVICENVAISLAPGERTMYRVQGPNSAWSWHEQLSSFHRDVILNHREKIADLESMITEQEVQLITLTELVARHNLEKKVEFLHLDTEGRDAEIILSIDFDQILPLMILFEHKHLCSADHEACCQLLKAKKYKCTSESEDTLCILR